MEKTVYPSLRGKVVVVTGAAQGIGRAIALAFAKQGARLVLDDLPTKADSLKATQQAAIESGAQVEIVLADVRVPAEVDTIISTAITAFGKIDVLVNNAGIVFDIDWDQKTHDQWSDTLNTNLVAPYLLVKAARQELLNSKGVVINITSTNAFKAMNPFSADYDASKAGLITLTHNLAKALAPDVRVNAIAPGWVNTDMNVDLEPSIVVEETKKIFIGRWAEPSEIASLALFLAADDSRYINGTTITIDGGYQ